MMVSNLTQLARRYVVLFALCAFAFTMIAPRPAAADGAASTRNIILGAAALTAGIIIYTNAQRKRAAAQNSIVGYTRDGGVVYGDGRIGYPSGRTMYASNGNGRRCSYDGRSERCGARPVAYYVRGESDRSSANNWQRHDNGEHKGWSKNGGHGAGRHPGHDDHDDSHGRGHDN